MTRSATSARPVPPPSRRSSPGTAVVRPTWRCRAWPRWKRASAAWSRSAPTATRPWRVLRISPADFLAGAVYVGEWQTKVRDLVQAVRPPRRVLVYVPNLQELSEAGRSSKSDSNIATALAPYLESGEVAVLGEST